MDGRARFRARGFALIVQAIAITALASCTTARAPMRDAVHQCEEYLPAGGYRVLETASIQNTGIFHILTNRTVGARFPEYFVAGHPAGGKPGRLQFFLLQRQPDELVYCEVQSPMCTPSLIWLKRAPGRAGGFDDWEVERTNVDQQICAVP